MVRLLRMELKNIINKRSTLIMAAAAIVLSVVFAYLPVTFIHADIDDGNGTFRDVSGFKALQVTRDLYSRWNGDVTPEKLKKALKPYLEVCEKYGDPNSDNFPKEVYRDAVAPDKVMTSQLAKTYADIISGAVICRDVKDLKLSDLDSYYDAHYDRLEKLLKVEGFSEEGKEKARALYSKVEFPFRYYAFYPSDALEYVSFTITVLILIGAWLSASVFSSDYESGADYIFRCTKFGKGKHIAAKIVASITTISLIFIIAVSAHLVISDLIYGKESLKTSIQILFDPVAAPLDANVLQMQILIAGAGLLSMIAVCALNCYISSKLEKTMISSGIAVLMVLVPTILHLALGNNWLSAVLPASGGSLLTAMLFQITDFRFLTLGSHTFWMPHVTVISAAICIPVFIILSARSYCKHQVY